MMPSAAVERAALGRQRADQRRANDLLNAAQRGNVKEARQLLTADAAAMASATANGQGLLHLAGKSAKENAGLNCKHTALARMLLEEGIEVDKCDDNGDTPLTLAAEAGSIELCMVLLDHGAAPQRRAIQRAKANGRTGPFTLLTKAKATSGPAAVAACKPAFRREALFDAAHHGHVKTVTQLLEDGIPANVKRTPGGLTVLQEICALKNSPWASFGQSQERRFNQETHLEVVRVLMRHGADVNEHTSGEAPLLLAVENNNMKLLVQLVKPIVAGGDMSTALLAARNGHTTGHTWMVPLLEDVQNLGGAVAVARSTSRACVERAYAKDDIVTALQAARAAGLSSDDKAVVEARERLGKTLCHPLFNALRMRNIREYNMPNIGAAELPAIRLVMEEVEQELVRTAASIDAGASLLSVFSPFSKRFGQIALEVAAAERAEDCSLTEVTPSWREPTFSDWTLLLLGKTYQVHRLVLAQTSSYFNTAFQTTVGSSTSTDLNVLFADVAEPMMLPAFEWLLDYFYAAAQGRFKSNLPETSSSQRFGYSSADLDPYSRDPMGIAARSLDPVSLVRAAPALFTRHSCPRV